MQADRLAASIASEGCCAIQFGSANTTFSMNPKQQLIKELENTPISTVKSVLDFLLYLKSKRPAADVMEFAGMLADEPELADGIISDSEAQRHFGLRQGNEAGAD